MKPIKLPFYILVGFNLLTWIIYVSNPYTQSASEAHYLTILYVLLNIIFLYFGFKRGITASQKYELRKSNDCGYFCKNYLGYYFAVYIITFTLKYAYELRCPVFNFGALINRILIGLANPELGYELTLHGTYAFSWSLYIILNFIDCGFFIIGMLCWSYMSRIFRTIFCLLTLLELLKWFGAGTSFGIMQICTTLMLVYMLNIKKTKLSKKQILKSITVVILIFFAAILAFGTNMQGRAGGEFQDISYTQINTDSFIYTYVIAYLPLWFQNLYDFIARYLVGGYYNLEYAFQVDYDWCFFLGSTNAMTTIADDIFNLGIKHLNYLSKIYMKFGVDPYIYWHSCYTWLANDFTLLGVPIVVYWIGKQTYIALSLFRRYNDIISGVLFVISANTIIYFFANNNYLSGHFYFVIFLWVLWRRNKYKVN